MANTSDEVTTILVAPVPPRVSSPAAHRDPEGRATSLEASLPASPDATAGSASEVLASLEEVRARLRRAAGGTFLVGAPSTSAALDQISAWHRQHPHLGYLDLRIDAPEGTRIDPIATGATRWITPAALRSTPLPPVGTLLSTLSGPAEVLLAAIDAVLDVPASEVSVLGSHALLAGLAGAGGVVAGRNTPRPATTSVTTPAPDDRADPAERLAVYRPPAWPRQQRQPGYTAVVEAERASVSDLAATVDSVLDGARGDVEVAVTGGSPEQAQLARRYAEEPRFRALEALRIGPRVLLVAEGSVLSHDTLVALARQHEEHTAGLLLVTHAGDDRRRCAASFETGAWRRAASLAGHGEVDALPAPADLRSVMEASYQTWWCNADDVGLQRPGAVAATASDLLDGTSAPSRRVLAELEKQQQLLASTRAQLRTVERDLRRLRGHPIVRVGRALRRHLP